MAEKRKNTRGSRNAAKTPARRGMYVVDGADNNRVKYIKPEPPSSPQRKKRRYGDGGVIMGIALLFLIIYIGGYLYSLFTREAIPETQVVYGSIEPVQVFSGIIVREETVYRSQTEGVVYYYKNNFDKINADGEVCSVQDEKTVAKLTETINSLENNIISAQENHTAYSAADAEKKSYNARISKAVDDAALGVNALDISAMYALTENVNQLLNHRNQVLFSENRGSVKTLSNELAMYQSQLDSAITPVKANKSGIISYKTDGLEETLTPERLGHLSQEETQMTVNYDELYSPSVVSAGDPIFKLITSSTWYIAAYLPADQTDGWIKDMQKPIYADDGNGNYKELMTRIRTLEKTENGMYVVFECARNMTDYLDCRSVSFKIKKGLTEGLKIPNAAIVEKTLLKIPAGCVVTSDRGATSVFKRVLTSEGVSFEQVTISVFSSDEEYVNIISDYNNVRYGDYLLLPDTLGEVAQIELIENIKGVYVTNSGAAVFRKITLSGEVFENMQYTIIDPALNPYVKVSDRIVSDAKFVDEKQTVY